MVLPLTGARSLGKIRGSWNGTGEPNRALVLRSRGSDTVDEVLRDLIALDADCGAVALRPNNYPSTRKSTIACVVSSSWRTGKYKCQ
jgi:hypothetical protein